jgi:hypothetical protein
VIELLDSDDEDTYLQNSQKANNDKILIKDEPIGIVKTILFDGRVLNLYINLSFGLCT